MSELTKPGVRTLLEAEIRRRRLTLDEFVDYAERFAREHGERGTISLRNLQRLVAGESNAQQIRPATARLLERIFEQDAEALLSTRVPDAGPVKAHHLRVAVAVVRKEHEVLMVSRRDSPVQTRTPWQFPSGVIKPGADSRAVAVAETLAETGVNVSHVRLVGARVHPLTMVHCEYHLCDYLSGDIVNRDVVENTAVTWLGANELLRVVPLSEVFPPLLSELGIAGRATQV